MDRVDCIVAGAGVIGLAIARELALRGRDVVILEAAAVIGSETSSRNNEVIHAGFLHPFGSLKAALCRRGANALYRYCEQRNIAHRRIGKLVISTSDTDTQALRRMVADAPRLGVHELRFLDGVEARRLEPQLRCRAAILSPYTGVIDTHALMLTLLAEAQAAGAMIAYETRLDAIRVERGSIIAHTIAESREYAIAAHILINAAGLGAAAIARSWYRDHHGAARAARVPEVDLAKGSFFALGGALPFARIIMPLSETLAMGGAFTIDSGGQGKFGPDLEWVDAVDYNVDETRAPRFAAAIRRYYPELEDERLRPDFAGIRPRLRAQGGAQGGAAPDWGVLGPEDHGVAGLFHLLGFETPGVTACLAIAEHVCDLAIARSEHAAGQRH